MSHSRSVKFVFAGEQGVEMRLALVVSTSEYHRGRREVILVAITSNISRLFPGDRMQLQRGFQATPPASDNSVKFRR